MLSIENIYSEFGKNIYIYPTKHLIIKGASVDLSASRFAWSLKTKKSIYDNEKRVIKIPAFDSAVIFTNEVLYVTNKIAGTYHSKVSFTANGLGHIGTTLDPEFIGPSKIIIHNHSSEDFELPENHTMVSVCFYKLDTKVVERAQPDCQDFIISMHDYEGYSEFKNYIDQNPWMLNSRKLKEKVKLDENFKAFRESLINESVGKHNLKLLLRKAAPVIILGAVFAALYFLVFRIDSQKGVDYLIALIFFVMPMITKFVFSLLE